MRNAVPLHEFMPYGAPDLLESRRRHLSGALLFASSLALAVYVLTTGLARLIPAPAVAPVPLPPDHRHQVWDTQVRHPEPPAIRPHTRLRAAVPEVAPPDPVPDEVAPPPKQEATGTGQVTDDAGPEAPPVDNGSAVGSEPEILPARGVWVYTEEMPKALREVKPDYPELPQQAGVEGPVMVYVLIGKDGQVLKTELSDKVQVPMLNEAAIAAARQWLFRPAYANGKPVACWTQITFRFRLH